jgi:hypothetical protein
MNTIDPLAAMKLQPELSSGETIYWAGMPNANTIFHSEDWHLMILWGIPFVVIGQYLIWGRFLYDAWLKRRTYYGITNRRVLILQEGQKRTTQFSFLESIPEITQEGDDIGTIWLGTKQPIFGTRQSGTSSWSRFSVGGSVPKLSDIDGVNSVYRLILDLREQARKQPSPAN